MSINILFILKQLLIGFLYWIFTSVFFNLATDSNNIFFILFLCSLFLGASILFHKKRDANETKKEIIIGDCIIVITFIFLSYIFGNAMDYLLFILRK